MQRTCLYKGHYFAVPMVSAVDRFHCTQKKVKLSMHSTISMVSGRKNKVNIFKSKRQNILTKRLLVYFISSTFSFRQFKWKSFIVVTNHTLEDFERVVSPVRRITRNFLSWNYMKTQGIFPQNQGNFFPISEKGQERPPPLAPVTINSDMTDNAIRKIITGRKRQDHKQRIFKTSKHIRKYSKDFPPTTRRSQLLYW